VDLEFLGKKFTREEICRILIWQGQWDSALLEALRVKCMPEWARQLSVTVSDQEVQEFADSYRLDNDLNEAQEMRSFLQRNGMNEDDFFEYCFSQALRLAVREHLCTDEKVHSYFLAHLGQFDRARISRIVVYDQELGNELLMRVGEDGEDFHKLAREYSRDEQTRHAGGYVGLVRREDLEYEASAMVFASQPGALLGPLSQDDQYHLILVEELLKAQLDEDVQEEIKDQLLADWELSLIHGD
jgi:parvulin-like peptidyl-prolyl isomerase